jgi:chemotaxis protein histidine kinase CheA
MKMINAVLREPAREEAAFRKKLDTLFRQVHSVKGEAAALGLSSIETRAHSFEDELKSLRDKQNLSGNDFLPLVIKLDDLLTHLQSVGDLVSRLSRLHLAAPAAGPVEPAVSHTDTEVIEDETMNIKQDTGVSATLQQLCARVAAENGKEAALTVAGFDIVPDAYRRVVKDIAIQALRNALVHGIESAADRVAAGKAPRGSVRLAFRDLGDVGYKLVAEDDGKGLSTERIKEVALKKGFLSPEKAGTLDAKQIFALLFQSGFSTMETATKDAGRGVGMNLIANLMQQVGGKVSVATMPGKYTRLTMTLPPAKRIGDTEAA